MSNSIELAKQTILSPTGLSDHQLEQLLGKLLGKSIDYADLYFQAIQHESWCLEDSIIKGGSFNVDRGVGIRAVSGEKSGFAYSNDIDFLALEQAAKAARSIALRGEEKSIQVNQKIKGHELYLPQNPLHSLNEQEKINILKKIDILARSLDPRVTHVQASLNGVYETVYMLNSHGIISADIRPLIRLNIDVMVEENGRREHATHGGGGRFDYQYFLTDELINEYTKEAVRAALLNLQAIPAPAGTMPVILGPGWPGVLLHEAIGHGLEGDFNRKGSSAFSGRIGERVAAPGCTVVDDGTLVNRRGSLNVDDEGTPTECTVLIEDGILKTYMQDKLNARLMNTKPTGNGRRESYAHLPMPRMTNTYMLNGQYDPKEIIQSVKKGLYAVNFGGGQVDITSGKFVFSASEAYLIEDGKITAPVKGATLIGNGPDVLTKVSMIGNDLALDHGVGTCGKEGQSVPVGVGQPTLKVDSITVGGTST